MNGIVTFCDAYQAGVAKAATTLGLPTLSADSFEVATNKYKTGVAAGRRLFRGFLVEDAIAIGDEIGFDAPLIVKPCIGWGSEGVFKVKSQSELVQATQQIDDAHHGTEFVVEEYCEGPEVDVNMVVYDGEILFYEISDDYPKSAESNSSGSPKTFIEMDSLAPSSLPAHEHDTLRQTFHEVLLRSNLNNGVFHIEGRLRNSHYEFRRDCNGILDHHVRQSIDTSLAPSAYLLDLNPRPPGMTASIAPQITYGINYHALSMLIALRDESRVRALAQPFVHENQY